MPLPILGAVAAVGKVAVVGTAKAATLGTKLVAGAAKVGTKATVSTGKFFGKTTLNIANSLSNNAKNLNKFLEKQNKNQDKLRSKKKEEKQKSQSIEKKREKEKQLESKRDSSNQKKTEQNLVKSPLNILNKLFAFGGLLLGGILVNAVKGLIDKAKQFVKDNQEIFDTIGNFLSGVKDAAVGLFNAFTGPESEQSWFDNIAKFGDDGKIIGGALLEVDKAYDKLEEMLKSVIPALKGAESSSTPTPSREELVRQTERGSGMASFREDAAENAALQESVRGRSTSPASSAPDLKTAIRRAESGNDYGATFRAYLDGFSRRNEDITNMSINQVVQYQKDYIAHQRKLGIPETKRSAAVGAYQMLYPEVAASKTGVSLTAKFNKENQDRMADYYLNMAGYQQFINGRITAEQFNNRLAGQFASLKTTSGRGVYDSDGINRAYEDLLDLIKKSKPQPKITPVPDKGDQARIINQPDPTDEEVATLFIQRVNTIQYIPVPS